MKVIMLACGYGPHISEESPLKPKPNGFRQYMDTQHDKQLLEKLWNSDAILWKI